MPKSSKPNRRPAARSRASAARQPQSREPIARTPRAPEPFVSPRQDGWTRERQTGFLQALAESGCVEEACASVGMSRQSAYRLRARIDAQGFRIAWDKAIDYAIRRLSDACLSRALHGEARPIFYKGEQIGERRVYDNKLAMFLLRYRDPLRYAASLDQMVYGGHTEGAAVSFAKAMSRVDAEADGLWEPEEADAHEAANDDMPFTHEPVADVLARAKEEAILASNAPIYGSHARQTRLTEARRAYQLKQSGYKSYREWDAAKQAEREATNRKVLEDLDRALYEAGDRPATFAPAPDAEAPPNPDSDRPDSDRPDSEGPDSEGGVVSPSSPSHGAAAPPASTWTVDPADSEWLLAPNGTRTRRPKGPSKPPSVRSFD